MEIETGSGSVIGRGRGRRQNSDVKESDRNDLRRPHTNPPELRPKSSGPTLPSSTDITVRSGNNIAMPQVSSTLSAEAPEFVPRFFSHTPQTVQQTNSPSHGSMHHQPTLVDANMVGDQGVFHISGPQFKYINHPVILQVNDIVVNLTMKPHKFDQIANQMTSILSWKVKEAGLMKEIISVVFEQGVGEPNFRFNGGRLCQHLSKHVTQSYEGLGFKALLLQKCQEEYTCREYYLQTEPSRLCGFTLFLADIFIHVVTPSSQNLNKLRESICTLLMTLMSNPTSLNLKCVAQVLKGSGNLIDAGAREEMDMVMCRLKDVTMTTKIQPKIQPNIRALLVSVIELRASNWGRGSEQGGGGESEPSSTPSEPDVPHIGTVYYGPGGVIQRVEEDNEDSASDTDDSYYGRVPPPSDELEGEVAKAFEEFLRDVENLDSPSRRNK